MNDYSRPVITSLGFDLNPKAKDPGRKESNVSPKEHQARILLVDDDPVNRNLITARLAAANYSVDAVAGARAALDVCSRSRPHLVITDWRLQDMDGFTLLKQLKGRWPDLTVIVLTAHGTIREAVQATQYGAFGFLVKPIERSELLGQVQRAIEHSTFKIEGDWRANIVSRSKLMEERLGQANWAAGNDAPVLLTGENGTGKELLARAIHAASARRGGPFIVVDCQAGEESWLDAKLFGGETDGDSGAGALHAAGGGTLLLHEIDCLSFALQVKLLDALRQSRSDVRLISATSRDLKQLMDSGKFRQDLYYAVNILPIEVPPLGRRREDIPLLVAHFLEQATQESGTKKIYSPKAIELLATTDWPGNVRQLFELVKQNVALSEGKVITEQFVQQSLGSDAAQVPTYDEARDKFSHDYLIENLQKTAGNISKSARLAKRNRTDFYKLLARYRIRPDDFKTPPNSKPDSTKS